MAKTDWTTAWRSPPVVIALIAGVVIFGYTVFFRMPDLEKRTDRLDADLHEQMKTINGDVRDQLKKDAER